MAVSGEQSYIESLGVYLPETQVSSKSRVAGVATRVKVPLQRFTGIESTRRVGKGEFSFDLACRAVEQCLARSAYGPEDIGLLIAANISKYDREGFTFSIEPNTATMLRARFGFRNSLAFDINNACAGVFTAILVADCLLHTSGIAAAMIVSGEYVSHLSDTAQREIRSLTDSRLACLTLGDAGAALILARSPDPAVGFRHIGLTTLGQHSDLCIGVPTNEEHGGGIMYTDSTELLNAGSTAAASHMLRTLNENHWNWDMVHHVIPHQVSVNATDAAVKLVNSWRDGVKLPRKKVIDNLAHRGNTSTTTHLVALQDHIENGRIDSGERIVFSIIASGLTVGTALYLLDDLPARLRNGKRARKNGNSNGHPREVRRDVSLASVASTRCHIGARASIQELCITAAENCLAKAQFSARDIDLLIFTGIFKDGFLAEPSYASVLAGKLLPHDGRVLAFDLHGGPGGLLASCEVVRAIKQRRGEVGAALVIAAESENGNASGAPVGMAEMASAALILPEARGGVTIGDCAFFVFEEHVNLYEAALKAVNPPHTAVEVLEEYETKVRESICRALDEYLPRLGRRLADFDEFHFPQISADFLHTLGHELGVPRDRVWDTTLEDKDLYTSGAACTLERSLCTGLRGSARSGLIVTAGPGIHVACAVVESRQREKKQ